jgi:hypothetical protein
VPLTLPAHASLLTALLPPEHGIHDIGGAGLGSGVPVIHGGVPAARLRPGAFVSASVLDSVFGLARGFDVYDDDAGGRRATRRANETVDAALAWLSTQGSQPAFTWVHLYDPHADYDPPAEYRARFATAVRRRDRVDGRARRAAWSPRARAPAGRDRRRPGRPTAKGWVITARTRTAR